MLVRRTGDVLQEAVTVEGAEKTGIRRLIAEEDGAPTFAMREIEVAPGGHTPNHSHAWEHEVYVIAGKGVVAGVEGDIPLQPGAVVFVPGGEMHCFKNAGEEAFRFLCLVPHPSARQNR